MKNDINELVDFSRTLKVLYVEDNKEARIQTLKLLSNFFDDIEVAKDGRYGLEKYIDLYETKNIYYDIVISDISMPNMDGIEMALQMLELNANQHVLMISAYSDPEKFKQLLDLGITKYISKPISNKDFFEKLSKIIRVIFDEKHKEKHIQNIEKLNLELDALIDAFDVYVIASRTDLTGKITYASKAYEKISGYSKDELLGRPHNIVRHPDMPSSAFKDMWDTIQAEKLWVGEVKNLKKDGNYYWVNAFIAPYYDKDKKHIGYSAIRINITSQKEVEKLNNKINTLLNNAGEGFLSFNKELKCDSSFSKECLKIFELDDITNFDISELLFAQDIKNKELFCNGIDRILESEDDQIKEIFLSLLPKEQIVHDKVIKIEYKLLNENHFMLILDDITKTKKLKMKIKEQEQVQKMLLAVAMSQNEFLDLKFDFENFLEHPPKKEKTFKRELHTFKGVFAQKEMLHIVEGIHDLETKINCQDEDLYRVFKEYNLELIFKKDLDLISEKLGKDFLHMKKTLKIEYLAIENLEKKIASIDNKIIKEILIDLEKLRYESLASMLSHYPLHVKNIAQKFEKFIYPLEIIGDENLRISPNFKPFIKALIHLFNNCIDHGIECAEQRADNEKDEMGTITCSYQKVDEQLVLKISDDGTGIDTQKLIKKAIINGLRSQEECDNMSEDDKLDLIFADKLSTKDTATITSGRGVGMSALKEELAKVDGTLKIKNSIGKGVKFEFTLPLGDD